MGLIQNAINQMIGTAGMAARLGADFEKHQEGSTLTKRGVSATAGLQSIQKSIERVEKSQSGEIPKDSPEYREPYSKSELKDISSRVGEHVSAIGALKTASSEGHPLQPFVSRKGLQARNEYSDMLTNIETKLEKMNQALSSAASEATAREEQLARFKEFSNMFTEGGRYR